MLAVCENRIVRKERLRKLKLETWTQIKDEAGALKIESDEEALRRGIVS
ncbi:MULTISPECIES: hypothetical protein [Candidatus Brocadia]|nr:MULTISPECIES: hypothetical protein [Brocadia]NOG43251.1 hypothetical protein [Planctomycetota bacterium]